MSGKQAGRRSGARRNWRIGAIGTLAVVAGSVIVHGAVAGSAATAYARAGSRLVVATTGGPIRGKPAGTVDEFLGLPYAAPPTGPLRWRPPHPPARWRGIREATRFAPHCPQPASYFGVASTSENCLYLNVFVPSAGSDHPLPVMVWLPGGALLVGESNDYDPAGLVRHGVIVVTVNYRLGALGFLAHPALARTPGGPSGNYGLMDQQAALRWVQANIGRFGGSRRNVTLFGESSGGLSVLAQLASPGARGLFSRAITESGTYNLTQAPLAAADAAGRAFAAQAGCASQTAACLRSLPVKTIVDNENFAGYRPDIDGSVLTQSIGSALADGQFNRVPVISGTNRDERRLFVAQSQLPPEDGPPVTAANYRAMIAATLGVPATAASAIAAEYPLTAYPSPALALGAVGTDAVFACPALTADRSLSRYVPTYAYEFSDRSAPELYLPPVGFPYGAAHESEVQYLFSLNNTRYPAPLSLAQQHLAAVMQQDWTGFAKAGVPAASAWPRFDSSRPRMLSLVPPQPRVQASFAAEHHCAFWAR
jgi:para-nitrobenzyl esterase